MSRQLVTQWVRIRPVRPYRSLDDFRAKHTRFNLRPAVWPCLDCRGLGGVYDPDDPPCPVEGDRYRRIIRCEACRGTGEGTKAACHQAYKAAVAAYHEEAREFNALAQIRKEALRILTKEQIHALRELGV